MTTLEGMRKGREKGNREKSTCKCTCTCRRNKTDHMTVTCHILDSLPNRRWRVVGVAVRQCQPLPLLYQ